MEGEKRVVTLDVNDVLPNRFQPRIQFDESAIEELSESIKRYGVIQPIIVRPIADKYEIIAGERRYKATVLADLPTISAIILNLNDKESAEIALIENIQRRNLTPIEEAVTYKKVLDMGYTTQSELANKLGVKQSTISNKLRLLNLSEEVQNALLENRISERHARSLLKLSDKNKQKKLLERIIKERLTVRRTDEEIKKILDKKEEVEILDFENFFEKKGEENMNANDPMNQFNIPTPTIDNDDAIIGGGISLQPTSTENKPNLMAPGFLDIDRIEKEAKDINGISNTVGEKPKFFNVPSENSEQPEMTANQAVGISPFSSTTNLEPSPVVAPNMNSIASTINPSPMESVMPSVSPMPTPVSPVINPSPMEPVMPNVNPVPTPVPPVFNPSPVEPVMPSVSPVSTPVPPVINPSPMESVMPSVSPMPTSVSPVINPSPVEPVMPNVNPVPTPVPPVINPSPVEPVMPSVSPVPTPVSPVINPSPVESAMPSASPEISKPSTIPSSYSDPVIKAVPPINLEYMDAIQSVHDLKDDLENRGFSVQLEENNFGTEYHFIIKVHKD